MQAGRDHFGAAARADSPASGTTTMLLPGQLCTLPNNFRLVWADYRTKAPAAAVDITISCRSDSRRPGQSR
jgi:hypothetical protein